MALGKRRDRVGGRGEVRKAPGGAGTAMNSAAELSAMLRVGNGSLLRAARRTLFPLLPGLIDDKDPDERSADDAANDGDDDHASSRHWIEETNAGVTVGIAVVIDGSISDAGVRRPRSIGVVITDAVISANNAAGCAAHERQGRVVIDDAGRIFSLARVDALVGQFGFGYKKNVRSHDVHSSFLRRRKVIAAVLLPRDLRLWRSVGGTLEPRHRSRIDSHMKRRLDEDRKRVDVDLSAF